MVSPDTIRKEGVEIPEGPKGPEFQGAPDKIREAVVGGRSVPMSVEGELRATSDLSNLSEAVKKANDESRGEFSVSDIKKDVSRESVAGILSGNEKFSPDMAYQKLEDLLNAGIEKK